MNIRPKLTAIGNNVWNFKRPLFRGGSMLVIGATLLSTIVLSPNIGMLGVLNYSWLLFCGYFLILLGFFEAVEALMAEELLGFLLSLQYALLDIVVGFMIDFNLGKDPSRLALLISAFLIIRGLGRLIFANIAELEERRAISFGGAISVVLGLMISLHWPTSEAWFMAFSLSLEIALRGWAQMMVAFWLKARQSNET